MAEDVGKPLNALAISELGRAFDARLKEETTGLETKLEDRSSELSRIEQRVEALFEVAEQRTGHLSGTLVGLKEDRARLIAELAECRENLANKRNECVRLMFRLEQQETASAQVSQNVVTEIQALLAREQALKETAQNAVTEIQALLAREQALKETAQNTVAETQALLAREQALKETAQNALTEIQALLTRERSRQEATLTDALSATSAAEARVDALMRNARAREGMLLETIAQVRLEERINAAREVVRAEHLARYVELLSQPFARLPTWISADRTTLSQQSVDAAVVWLAKHAEAAMGAGPDHDFEVMAGKRWTDRTFVAAGYSWLLGRPADEVGAAHYIRLLCGGLQRRAFLTSLACSREARTRLIMLTDGLGYDANAFVQRAYHIVLGRPADGKGLGHYLAMQNKRHAGIRILFDLASSREGRHSGTPLAAALRVMRRMATPQAFIRRKLIGPFEQRSARGHHIWQAGRIAALACEADLVSQDLEARISLLAEDADRRVMQARQAIQGPASTGPVSPPVTPLQQSLDLILKDSSAQRNPVAIRAAIRGELSAVGLQ